MRQRLKKYLPDHRSISEKGWLKPFHAWLLHPHLWHINRHSAAGAVAAGLFCGLIPGPLQMPSAAICAVIFRVNLPLAMAVTLYTNPLTLVPLYVLAYQIGSWLSGNEGDVRQPPEMVNFDVASWSQSMLGWMVEAGKPLLIGLPALATLLAIFGYIGIKLAWRFYLVSSWRKRQKKGLPR